MFDSRVLRKIFGPKTAEVKGNGNYTENSIGSHSLVLTEIVTVCNTSIFKRDDTSGAGSIPVFSLTIILCHFQLHYHLSRMLAHPLRHWAIIKAHFVTVNASMVFHMLQ
jgi:hypothetical protein